MFVVAVGNFSISVPQAVIAVVAFAVVVVVAVAVVAVPQAAICHQG